MEKQVKMTARGIIENYLIGGIGKVVELNPYLAFILMASGIEFLGRCFFDDKWDEDKETDKYFSKALESLEPLKKYNNVQTNDDKKKTKPELYKFFRCALVHSFMPGNIYKLSNESNNLESIPHIIGCRDFYKDFKDACKLVINGEVNDIKKKLDEDLIVINNNITGSTQNI